MSPLYCVYTVRSGDTLSKIATQFGLKGTAGVASWELVVQSNKPDIISADDYIQPGQKLRIPLKNGIVHVVLTGETLGELSSAYGVAPTAVADAANTVAATGLLTIGQELLITDPGKVPSARTASAAATPSPTPTPAIPPPIATAAGDSSPAPSSSPSASASASGSATARPGSATATRTPARTGTAGPAARSATGFIWPAGGPISSYYGPSHPLGIDIDLYADPNAPIVAAAAGTVTFAGGNSCCSYGIYVILDHGNGYTTVYGHLSRINVAAGQRVTQGQLLGLGGRTGYATGNHLHFEVRYNDGIINPLSVLP